MEEDFPSYTITKNLLGQGAYGNVYLGKTHNGKDIAVKCCPLDRTGVPNILETSIMASSNHPCINNSLDIQVGDRKLYIISELAECDLSRKTRHNKQNYKPNLDELRRWCFSIASAVDYLHSQGIIHADIKASNILYYSDGSVKLSDFTLATLKTRSDQTFNKNVCTCTHRPLECFLKKDWNESLDIWSLGCTFYEIAYGTLLFPYQGDADEKKQQGPWRKIVNQKTINCIIDWGTRENITNDIKIFDIEFTPAKFVEQYFDQSMTKFNDLLMKMLQLNPNSRITIKEVLKHSFFDNCTPVTYRQSVRITPKMPLAVQARASRYIEQYTTDTDIKKLAYNIFSFCIDIDPKYNEKIKATTSAWIASKILGNRPPTEDLPLHWILPCEREMCNHLKFQIH